MTAGTRLRYLITRDSAQESPPGTHGSVHLVARRIATVAVRAGEPVFLVDVALEQLSGAPQIALQSRVAGCAAIFLRLRMRCLCLRSQGEDQDKCRRCDLSHFQYPRTENTTTYEINAIPMPCKSAVFPFRSRWSSQNGTS